MKRIDSLKALLQENDKDPFLLFALAKEYEKMGNDELALDEFSSLKQQSPEYIGLYYHMAKLIERSGDVEEALKIYDEGINQAKSQGDQHSLSELKNARLNLEMEY